MALPPKKKNLDLKRDDLMNFIDFLTKSIDFFIMEVPEEGYDDIVALISNDEDGELKKWIHAFPRVVHLQFYLKQNDFINIVAELFNDKEAIKGETIVYMVTVPDDTLYYIELNKVKVRRSSKPNAELEVEIQDAVKKEDYELAAKLRDKLKKRFIKK